MPKQESYNPNYHLHKMKLPFRACIVGVAGSGKTNFLSNLIYMFSQGEHGTFESIHIYTRNKNEPLYDWLTQISNGSIIITDCMQTLPTFDDCKSNHLVVLDDPDPELSKNPDTLLYWIDSRMQNISVVYISHTFYEIPRMIRSGCSYYFLFQLAGTREWKIILSQLGRGVIKEELLKLHAEATKEKFQPLTIDTNAKERFRAGLKCLRSV